MRGEKGEGGKKVAERITNLLSCIAFAEGRRERKEGERGGRGRLSQGRRKGYLQALRA